MRADVRRQAGVGAVAQARPIARAISAGGRGGRSSTRSPKYSRVQPYGVTTTARPARAASSAARPGVSNQLGRAKTRAAA